MNKVAHKGKIPDIQVLAASIKKIAMDHCNAWKSSYLISVDRWFPSFPSSYKINFDMTIRDSFSAQAVVCCDSNGKILQAISHISPTCDSNFGEALVARLVVSLAVLLNFLDFSLERDSHVVIMSFQHPFIVQDWKIANIISDSFKYIQTSFIWEAKKIHKNVIELQLNLILTVFSLFFFFLSPYYLHL